MESLGKIAKFSSAKPSSFAKASEDSQLYNIKRLAKKNTHLHSPAHVLADELAVKLNDKKHFALYLGLAIKFDHQFLRKVMGEVLENPKAENPGKLFAYLVKKYSQELKI